MVFGQQEVVNVGTESMEVFLMGIFMSPFSPYHAVISNNILHLAEKGVIKHMKGLAREELKKRENLAIVDFAGQVVERSAAVHSLNIVEVSGPLYLLATLLGVSLCCLGAELALSFLLP